MYINDTLSFLGNDTLNIPFLFVQLPIRASLVSRNVITQSNGQLDYISYQMRLGVYTKFYEDINGNQILMTDEQEDNIDNLVNVNNINKLSVQSLMLGDTERYVLQIVNKMLIDYDNGESKFAINNVNLLGKVQTSDNLFVGTEVSFDLLVFNNYACESESTDVFTN